jgi:hypothetical protein
MQIIERFLLLNSPTIHQKTGAFPTLNSTIHLTSPHKNSSLADHLSCKNHILTTSFLLWQFKHVGEFLTQMLVTCALLQMNKISADTIDAIEI